MYRLLVVDDEEYAVDSVLFYLEDIKDVSLETMGCHSAKEALALMERMRVDILITDIRMPEMDGLTLQREVVKRWPACRTIFLSGYVEFDYVQQAIRGGGCDYLLKTEGRETILRAVRNAAAQLDETVRRDVLLREVQARLAEALPALRHQLLRGILRSPRALPEDLPAALSSMSLPLKAENQVLLVLGQLDVPLPDAWENERALATAEGIVAHHMEAALTSCAVTYGTAAVWLFQPREGGDWSRARLFLSEAIEDAQTRCVRLLGRDMSFAVAHRETPWSALSAQRRRLEYLLRLQPLTRAILLEQPQAAPSAAPIEGRLREQLEQTHLLAAYMDAGNLCDFFDLLGEILQVLSRGASPALEDARLELISRMCALLITQVNYWGIKSELAKQIDLQLLYNGLGGLDWEDSAAYIRRLAQWVFSVRAEQSAFEGDDMVSRLRWVIQQNLGGDLSLPRLGELVGMNPYYMARLYQKITGERLTAWIAAARLGRARELLAGGGMVVRDIAKATGFSSEQAFHRFFKRLEGMTPQEFRGKCKRDNP